MSDFYARFQTNILVPSKNRPRYIKLLEKILPDPRISYVRIIGGMALAAGLIIVEMFFLSSDNARLPYLLGPMLGIGFSWIVLTLLWMMPSREGRSMLSVIASSAFFTIAERVRMRTERNGRLHSIGVSAIDDDGLIHFSSGDVGYIYSTEGQVGLSTLPQIAEDIARKRHHWLRARENTSGHQTITTVSRKDSSAQLDYYRRARKEASRERDSLDARAAMEYARVQHEYTKLAVHHHDIYINQYDLVRDIDEHTLNSRSVKQFENWVADGMLARANIITDRNEIERILRPLVLVDEG